MQRWLSDRGWHIPLVHSIMMHDYPSYDRVTEVVHALGPEGACEFFWENGEWRSDDEAREIRKAEKASREAEKQQ